MAIDPEEPLVVVTEGESAPGVGYGLHAGRGFEFLLDFAEGGADGGGIGVHACGWKREAEGKDMGGIEAGVDAV